MSTFDSLFNLKEKSNIYKEQVPELVKYLKNKQGWIYVSHSIINEVGGTPKMLKIGRTSKGAMERAKSLSSTGVAEPYKVLFSLPFLNQYIAENNISHKLKKYRGNKEFYYVTLDMAVNSIEEEYRRQKVALERYFNFDMIRDDIDTLEFYLNK